MALSQNIQRSRTAFNPRSIPGLALWLDAADSSTLYQTDASLALAVNTPTEIGTCAIWLDGADATSMFDATTGGSQVVAGGAVARWQDKSGNSRHATQPTAANRPLLQANAINGRSCVRGDGSRWMVCESSNLNATAITVFTVYRINEWQTGIAPFTNNQNLYHTDFPASGFTNFGLRSEQGSNQLDARIGDADSSQSWSLGLTVAAQGVVDIQTARVSGSTVTARVSATQRTASTINSANIPATYGSRVSVLTGFAETHGSGFDRRLRGDIAEFIVFTSALADADVLRIEKYLAQKWAVSQAIAPATATNDPVGAWQDKSGNGLHVSQATDTRRPSLSAVAGKSAVDFDGAGDFLERPAFTGSVRTVLTAHVLDVVNVSQVLYAIRNATPNGLAMLVSGAGDYRAVVRDTNETFFASGFVATPGVARFTHQTFTGSFDPFIPVDVGVDGAPLPQSSTASFGNNQSILLGCRLASASVYDVALNGKLCEVIGYDRVLSAAEIASVRRHLAAKWGINLAPQVSNADAQDWINRVYANGGTVSATTASAVNQFCNAVDSAGIRDRFYRLNLFAGNSNSTLAAVRTPLYRGPSLTGTQYGGTTDTNFNFVPGDYAETGSSGGLAGNGSTKYLNTGFAQNILLASDRHLSVYEIARDPGVYRVSIGSRTGSSSSSNTFYLTSTGAASQFSYVGQADAGSFPCSYNAYTHPNAHFIGTQSPATAVALYVNGAVVASASVGAPTPSGLAQFVFALNDSGAVGDVSAARLGGYSIGLSLSASQALAYSNAMQVFQASLSRSI